MTDCGNSWTTDGGDVMQSRWAAECVEVVQFVEQIQGPPGRDGIDGASGFSDHVHTQVALSDTWTVAHNLNRKPLVAVTSVGGVEWLGGEILHLSSNVLQIVFDQPAAGFARCI